MVWNTATAWCEATGEETFSVAGFDTETVLCYMVTLPHAPHPVGTATTKFAVVIAVDWGKPGGSSSTEII